MERRLPRVFLALLAPIYLIYLFAPGFGHFHDDGIYLTTSHALATGKGYIHESLPVAVPQTKYPFLYPALLAPFWFLTASPFVVAFLGKLLSFLALLAWTFVVRRLIAHWISNEEVLDWISFFSLAAPWTLYIGTTVLPDTLFALLCALCLLTLLEMEGATGKRRWALLLAAALAAAAAFLIRTTGLAVLLAAFLFLLRRRAKDGLVFALVSGLLCAPWLLWQSSQSVPLDPVLIYYSKLSYAKGQILSGYSWQQMLSVFVYNAIMLMTPFLLWIPSMPFSLALVLGLALAVMGLLGLIRSLRQGEHLALWALLYTGILLCWIWPPYRYAFPALPIYLLLWSLGIRPLLRTQWRIHAARFVVALFAVAAIVSNAASARSTLELGSAGVGWAKADNWKQHLEMLHWIQSNTPETAIIAANLDPMVFLLTGRKAVRPFQHMQYELFYTGENGPSAVGAATDIVDHFQRNGVTHILISPMNNFREKRSFEPAFAQILRDYPLVFRKVKEIAGSGYAIFAVDRSALARAVMPAQAPSGRPLSSSALSTAPSNASN